MAILDEIDSGTQLAVLPLPLPPSLPTLSLLPPPCCCCFACHR